MASGYQRLGEPPPQPLSSRLSVNPAQVLLNFPLLSVKKHFPFAEILIVRTKTPLATRVTTNRVEPADRDQLPAETVEMLMRLLSPSLSVWGEGEGSFVAVWYALSPFPCAAEGDLMAGQRSRTRNKGAISSLMGTFLPGWSPKDPSIRLLATPELFPEGGLVLAFSWPRHFPRRNRSSGVTTLPHTPGHGEKL